MLAALACAAMGCSTVIKTSSEDDTASVAERAALMEAAAGAAWAPWPKPSSSSIAERLTGGEPSPERISRDDAVEAYVDQLKNTTDGAAILMNDASRHLAAAKTLMVVAEEACDAASPRLSDVAILEDAIADLRETRTIYVASLKKIDAEKDMVEQVKRDFDRALKDLGDVADQLAENAMKRRADNFAGSNATVRPAGTF
ncbi:MAG: hypothetical protein A3E78_04770 [Alphaproteobacteria bacterium RIFCSPHIGHO2_12_FULL_63_12]|nr:MAG: hypothetical protein A3E78_04770 [Alphaproteobacteria bacterium RIFCSPHIGHO2_12_FULL_63_12]